MNARTAFALALALPLAAVACKSSSDDGKTPNPPSSAASASTKARSTGKDPGSAAPTGSPGASAPAPSSSAPAANECANGGDEVGDKVSASFFPRAAGNYCVNGQSVKSYGTPDGKFTMDQVCTTAMDGGCEEYKSLGVKRVVLLTYRDGRGKPNTVNATLSQFGTAAGAFTMYTKRVAASDPGAEAAKEDGTKPLAAGGAAASGGGIVNLWKGEYLLELAFVSEDANMSKLAFKKAAREACEPIAKELAAKLPGTNDPLPAVKLLPEADRYPLGLDYAMKDAFGVKNVGPLAIGYYHSGDTRYRLVAIVKDSADQAKSALGAIKSSANGEGLAGVGDEGTTAKLTGGDGKTALQAFFARVGTNVLGIVDDELGGEKKLSQEEKLAKLKEWSKAPKP
jgi:hypothetical protein